MQFQIPVDASLDASGWLPDVLDALLDLSVQVPFAEAEIVSRKFGRDISSSELERLVKPYGVVCSEQVRSVLLEASWLSRKNQAVLAGSLWRKPMGLWCWAGPRTVFVRAWKSSR